MIFGGNRPRLKNSLKNEVCSHRCTSCERLFGDFVLWQVMGARGSSPEGDLEAGSDPCWHGLVGKIRSETKFIWTLNLRRIFNANYCRDFTFNVKVRKIFKLVA